MRKILEEDEREKMQGLNPMQVALSDTSSGSASKDLDVSDSEASALSDAAMNHYDTQLCGRRGSSFPSQEKPGTMAKSRTCSAPATAVSSLVEGIFSCFQPLLTKTWKYPSKTASAAVDWEIQYCDLKNMEFLASGGQGSIYLAHYHNGPVAVKKVPDVSHLKDVFYLRKLQHPNIVQFFGVCSAPGDPACIIMEFCPNGTLMQFIKQRRDVGIAPELVVDWAKQIAEGMHYLHSHKIVHRDLKTPNVLIAEDGAVKISDFGTSKKWANSDSTEWKMNSAVMTFAGTIPWMSPEMVRSEKCSEKVDIWSYGVVLWELLTCEIPYRDVDHAQVLYGVGHSCLRLPVPSTCPQGFNLLLNQCWAAKPANRPSFRHILMHLDIAAVEILSVPAQEFHRTQENWRAEIGADLADKQEMLLEQFTSVTSGPPSTLSDEVDAGKFEEDVKAAQILKRYYEERLQSATELFQEVKAYEVQVKERERNVAQKERDLKEKEASQTVAQSRRASLIRRGSF